MADTSGTHPIESGAAAERGVDEAPDDTPKTDDAEQTDESEQTDGDAGGAGAKTEE